MNASLKSGYEKTWGGGHAMAQLVKARGLRLEGRGVDS